MYNVHTHLDLPLTNTFTNTYTQVPALLLNDIPRTKTHMHTYHILINTHTNMLTHAHTQRCFSCTPESASQASLKDIPLTKTHMHTYHI